MTVTIYHNPRCSKSRQALQLLEQKGCQPLIVDYLQHPPSVAELTGIIAQLGISPRQLLRKQEEAFKTEGLQDPNLSDQQIIEAMVRSPKLIERPIVLANGKAALGRPPEAVLAIL